MKIWFEIFSAPRTKKNSRVHTRTGIPVPSKAFQAWARIALDQKTRIQAIFPGILPIRGLVTVKALFYKDRVGGDSVGYYQGLGDLMQAEAWKCERPDRYAPPPEAKVKGRCRKITVGKNPGRCPFCTWPGLRKYRDGLGIIADDAQIANWNNSDHLLIDRDNPRIYVEVETLEVPGQQELGLEVEDDEEEDD